MSEREQQVDHLLKRITFNENSPYKRKIVSIEQIKSSRCRIVFHTAASLLENVDPQFCQSFDYCLDDKPLPVSFVLPYPHVNRVKGFSEIWSDKRKLAQEKFGYSHSYLVIKDSVGYPYAQIRLGSQMQGAFLLAAENRSGVLRMRTRVEGGVNFEEWITIESLDVVDHFKFTESSPVGFATGGRLETHTNISISTHKLVGYHEFEDAITLFEGEDKKQLYGLKEKLAVARTQGCNPLSTHFNNLKEGKDYLSLEQSNIE